MYRSVNDKIFCSNIRGKTLNCSNKYRGRVQIFQNTRKREGPSVSICVHVNKWETNHVYLLRGYPELGSIINPKLNINIPVKDIKSS